MYLIPCSSRSVVVNPTIEFARYMNFPCSMYITTVLAKYVPQQGTFYRFSISNQRNGKVTFVPKCLYPLVHLKLLKCLAAESRCHRSLVWLSTRTRCSMSMTFWTTCGCIWSRPHPPSGMYYIWLARLREVPSLVPGQPTSSRHFENGHCILLLKMAPGNVLEGDYTGSPQPTSDRTLFY